MRRIEARQAFDAGEGFDNLSLTIADGRIAALEAAGAPEDVIVLPAIANAHDHARPLRSSSVGAFGRPLETWLHRLALFAPVDPYLATLAPLARAALGGQGAVMIHHVRPMGFTDYVTEAGEMTRAARDVGIRIAFGVGMRDRNPLVYGEHETLLADLDGAARAESRAAISRRCSRSRTSSRGSTPSPRRSAVRWSMSSMRPTARNGARTPCWKRSPRPQQGPAGG